MRGRAGTGLLVGWGALAGVKQLKLRFATMGRVCSGFFASSTLKHTPGAHRSAWDPPQYARVGPNTINPLIRHPALKPGTTLSTVAVPLLKSDPKHIR